MIAITSDMYDSTLGKSLKFAQEDENKLHLNLEIQSNAVSFHFSL